jgi:hypothetical protein
MVPTYLLPYLGSNSLALNAAAAAGGFTLSPQFWLHLVSLLVLWVLAFARGSLVSKAWIIIFPILATVFDLVPGLSSIPFVPTVMHLLAIIIGVSSSKATATATA